MSHIDLEAYLTLLVEAFKSLWNHRYSMTKQRDRILRQRSEERLLVDIDR